MELGATLSLLIYQRNPVRLVLTISQNIHLQYRAAAVAIAAYLR